jgi:glycosyltransferase involved in cell wall biosynthesis
MQPKVSIIIPVYNTQEFLVQCLDSILNQTLDNLEIICVENGSTDSSLEILNEYSQSYTHLKVIIHPEGRLGDARNAGLRLAKGEYIGFVDSDDFIDPTMFENLYRVAFKHSADIAICGITVFYQKDNVYLEKEPEIFPNSEFVPIQQNKKFFRNLTAWNKIYKKSFLDKHNFEFPEDLYYEDQLFLIKAFVLANGIASISKPLYYYRKQRADQISTLSSNHLFDIFKIFIQIDEFLNYYKIQDDFKNDIAEIKIQRLLYLFDYISKEQKKEFFLQMQKEFKDIHLCPPLEIASNTEYNNFRIIRNKSYVTSNTLLYTRRMLGQLLKIGIIRNLYIIFRKRKFFK